MSYIFIETYITKEEASIVLNEISYFEAETGMDVTSVVLLIAFIITSSTAVTTFYGKSNFVDDLNLNFSKVDLTYAKFQLQCLHDCQQDPNCLVVGIYEKPVEKLKCFKMINDIARNTSTTDEQIYLEGNQYTNAPCRRLKKLLLKRKRKCKYF